MVCSGSSQRSRRRRAHTSSDSVRSARRDRARRRRSEPAGNAQSASIASCRRLSFRSHVPSKMRYAPPGVATTEMNTSSSGSSSCAMGCVPGRSSIQGLELCRRRRLVSAAVEQGQVGQRVEPDAPPSHMPVQSITHLPRRRSRPDRTVPAPVRHSRTTGGLARTTSGADLSGTADAAASCGTLIEHTLSGDA